MCVSCLGIWGEIKCRFKMKWDIGQFRSKNAAVDFLSKQGVADRLEEEGLISVY